VTSPSSNSEVAGLEFKLQCFPQYLHMPPLHSEAAFLSGNCLKFQAAAHGQVPEGPKSWVVDPPPPCSSLVLEHLMQSRYAPDPVPSHPTHQKTP
jgi:hypothetical protein